VPVVRLPAGQWIGIAGYLVTARRALPVGDVRTVLAGWNPGETYLAHQYLDAGRTSYHLGE
jgi:hypothetical protein